MKIGIFDSGIGGFSLLSELASRVADAEFIYYADSKNAPYGEKSEEEILKLSDRAINFLTERGAEAIVIACNTATAAAAKSLREKYPSLAIFGMEPAINEAAKKIKDGQILATATPLTLKGRKYNNLLDKTGAKTRTLSLPMPLLVRLAERDFFHGKKRACPDADLYIKQAIESASEISAIVLGCTHFVYFKESFKKYLPDGCPIFNGISGTANHVVRTLSLGERGARLVGGEGAKETLGRTEFYISGERADRETMEKIENCISLLFDVRE